MGFWDGMNQGGGGFWGGMGASSPAPQNNKKPQPKQDLGSMLGNALLGLGKGIVHSAVNDAHTIADLPVQAGKSLYYLSHGDVAGAAKSQQNSFIGKQYGSKFAGDTSGLGNAGSFALDMAGLKGGGAVANQAAKGALKTATIQGIKTGAGFGAGYGVTQSLTDNQHDFWKVGQNVATNAAIGGALGGVAPGAIKGGEIAGKAAYKGGKIAAKEAEGYAVRNADKIANASVALTQNPSLTSGIAGLHPGALAGVPTAGYQAGARAARYDKASDRGLTYKGADGQPRVPVSNEGAKLNPAAADALRMENKPTTLRELLPHKEFEKDYKPLRDIPVLPAKNDPGIKAVYDPARKAILVDPAQMPSDQVGWREVLLHERNHAVQDYEGHAQGMMPGETDPGNINPTEDMQALKLDMNRHQGVMLQRETVFKDLRAKVDPKLPKKEYLAQIQKIHDKVYDQGYKYARSEYEDLKYQHDQLKAQAAKDPERIAIASKYKNSLGEAEAHRDAESTLSQKQIEAQVKTGDFDLYHGLDPKQAEISFKPQMAAYAEKPKPNTGPRELEFQQQRYLEQLKTAKTDKQRQFLHSKISQLERQITGRDPLTPLKVGKPSPVKAKEITPPAPEPPKPKSTGEQIGRLKAAITKETDPNVKAELSKQLADFKKKYGMEKQAQASEQATVQKPTPGVDSSYQHIADAPTATKKLAEQKAKADAEAKATEEAINRQKEAPAPIELPKVQEGDHKQAILNSRAVPNLIKERLNPVLKAIGKLSPADHALLDDLRTTSPETLAKRAKNPTAFLEAAKKAKEFNDYTHAIGTGQGQAINYRKNYGASELWDLSDKETADILEQYQAKLKDKPGYSKERMIPDYKTGEALGMKRLNPDFATDLKHDAGRRANDISEMALYKGLEQAYPNQVAIGTIPRGYTALQIAHGKSIALPTEIAEKLNKRGVAPTVNNPLLKGYDATNRGLKYAGLGGGTFHALTTTGTALGQQIMSGKLLTDPVGNMHLITGTLSKAAHSAHLKAWSENGAMHPDGLSTVDRAHLAGVTLRPEDILGDANIKLMTKVENSRLNFIRAVHDMVFARQIPEAKQMIFEQATRKLDTNNPADLAKMRKIASAVNNFGGINRAIEGLTPRDAQNAARFVLATDFTETKYRKLADMLTGRGGDRKIAAQMVIGKAIVMALPGLTVAAASGALQTPLDWAEEAGKQILDPQFATTIKDKNGNNKVAKLPSTEISELGRILLPIFTDDKNRMSGAEHYITARSAAGLSTIWSLISNKDYFGAPVIANKDDGSVDVLKTAGNLASSKAPIPVSQGIKVVQGKQGIGEAALNTLGLRVSTNKEATGLPQQAGDEVKRLQKAGYNSLGTTPGATKLETDGETVKLDRDQQQAYNSAVQKQVSQTWSQVMATPEYKDMNDKDKASVLKRVRDDIEAVTKKDTLSKMGKDGLSQSVVLTKEQGYVRDGSSTPSDFINATLDAADAKYRRENGIKKTPSPKFKTTGSARIRKGRIAKGKTPHVAKAKVAHLPKPKRIKVNTAPNSKLATALMNIGQKKA